ncbi:cell division protein FtsZ [Thiomicrorhabdus sp. 6S2-11]|jgi:cell division protein FtsZ|uniref:Cell division protein FtsZ n=1 Tax=Thiomicrorhabdus marina TaxID=2818442 RepID=A0ABS3Q4X3_9GAMM|nr:cell division protein FtsZ [Thiomicrorhabdus marina]MBO1927213.1 cell division protein FtsZ [Thiomicrorhabdus marina]
MKFISEDAPAGDIRQAGMPVIKVIGLGGGGGNAVNYMMENTIEGVDFLVANTDAQALAHSHVQKRIQLGEKGLGAGADPEKGRMATKDSLEMLKREIEGADMLFLAAGMGGGTGTGSAPVVAQLAREMGVLVVGVVSKPFSYERRGRAAEAGIEELTQHVDSLITIPNDKLQEIVGDDFTLNNAFNYANEILLSAVQGITELVTRPGLINVDFEDLRTVMSERGMALMGVGHATGEDRAIKATKKAVAHPLLDDIEVSGAKGILINVTSGPNLTISEFNAVGDVIDQVAAPDAKVIIGNSLDESMNDEIRVTVVATGLTKREEQTIAPQQTARNVGLNSAVNQMQQSSQAEAPAAQQVVHQQPNYAQHQTVATPNYQVQSAQPQVVETSPAFAEQAVQQPHYQPQMNTVVQPQVDQVAQQKIDNEAKEQRSVIAEMANGFSSGELLDIPAFLRRQKD